MKKKIVSVIMAAVMSVAVSGMPVFASEQTITADGTASVEISASVSSSYSVVLPGTTQILSDENNDGYYEAEVAYDVYGKINSNRALIVCAGEDVNLSRYTKAWLTSSEDVADGYILNSFSMTGQTSGKKCTGGAMQYKVRFVAPGGAETDFDQAVSKTKATTAPYTVDLSIELSEADIYSGALQFSFGIVEK